MIEWISATYSNKFATRFLARYGANDISRRLTVMFKLLFFNQFTNIYWDI